MSVYVCGKKKGLLFALHSYKVMHDSGSSKEDWFVVFYLEN